jgi:long-subunit acyl-CoA synthetase (AMP-forming)
MALEEESIILPTIEETDLAVILHTSGSSAPKGVKLSQGQQSASNMVKTYLWNTEDNYLSRI